MKIIFSLLILCAGNYTFTYGVSLWREDKNKLGGFGTIVIAVLGTLAPITVLFFR